MKKINPNLQKGVVVLIAAMLLTIPNIRVYSAIGSYETSSIAIAANHNNSRQHSQKRNDKRCVSEFMLGMAGFSICLIAGVVGIAILSHQTKYNEFKTSMFRNYFDGNYEKYDFSQFDN